MKDTRVELLFPTPILFTNIDRPFTEEEYATFNNQKFHRNYGNLLSENKYVLNEPKLKNLKAEIMQVTNQFFQDVYKPRDTVSVYITQSWINITSKGEYHHAHTHSNSFISGALSIQTVENDKLTYHRDTHPQIEIDFTEPNIFNAKSWWYPLKTGDISVFPSTVMHGVDTVTSEGTRISLAFNAFVKGKLTRDGTLYELTI
jgi:uncharacterized protein (TIGR02466 family)